jgi:hypothetical protein
MGERGAKRIVYQLFVKKPKGKKKFKPKSRRNVIILLKGSANKSTGDTAAIRLLYNPIL